MLVEKVSFGPKQGKTKAAIEQAAEQLLLQNFVVYVTNELSHIEVQARVMEEAPDALLVNLVVECGTAIEQILDIYPEDAVIIIDGGITEKEIDAIQCENPLYVYYQARANTPQKVV